MIVEAVIILVSLVSIYELISTESSVNEYMKSKEHIEYSAKRRKRLEDGKH